MDKRNTRQLKTKELFTNPVQNRDLNGPKREMAFISLIHFTANAEVERFKNV